MGAGGLRRRLPAPRVALRPRERHSDVAAGVKKAMDSAKSDKDTVKVLMQVKSGDQTRFVALSLKKA